MIDYFDKNSIDGKTLYLVYRSSKQIPSTVIVRTYTDCKFSKYHCKQYNNGMVDIRFDIYGIDGNGKEVYVRGYNGVINPNLKQNILENLFISKHEANLKRKEILNEIEKDIESYVISSKDIIESSKAILAEAKQDNPLVSDEEILDLVLSAV